MHPEEIKDPILREVKKAIDLYSVKTYNESEFYSHILAIIRDNTQNELYHKEQLERLLYKVDEFREVHRMVINGNRSLWHKMINLGNDLDKKINTMITVMCYSIERFKKSKPVQNSIFGK